MGNEKFIRWQGLTINQLTFAINLFLGLGGGSLAFAITLLRDQTFLLGGCWKTVFLISLVTLALSVIAGCAAVVSRLYDFRYTARKLRADELGDPTDEAGAYAYSSKILGLFTWRLFWFELVTLFVGLIGLILAIYSRYADKLW
jgi:hypothetical protein